MTSDESKISPNTIRDFGRGKVIRAWVASGVVILVVFAVWKFIDYRMRPPPPPNKVVIPVPAPSP